MGWDWAEIKWNDLNKTFFPSRFVDKFTEFLGSFVKSHLRRFESNAQFPILSFLNILFKYTFEQQRTESYLACLDVWNICIDYVQGLIFSRVPEADVIVPKYRGFLLLASEVLRQVQFRCVEDKLLELDDEEFDDDEETQWQHYLRASIECIMRVAEVFPNDILRIIVSTQPLILYCIVHAFPGMAGQQLQKLPLWKLSQTGRRKGRSLFEALVASGACFDTRSISKQCNATNMAMKSLTWTSF